VAILVTLFFRASTENYLPAIEQSTETSIRSSSSEADARLA
jgi:hypothetical protein